MIGKQMNDMSSIAETTATMSVSIDGMTCASCVRHIERALSAIPGVTAVNVNLALEKAEVEAKKGQVSTAQITQAIVEAGYTPREQTTVLAIGGMSCAACVSRLEKVLAKVPSVVSASVNLANETATIRFLGSDIANNLIAAVKGAGFEAKVKTHDNDGTASLPSDRKEKIHLIAGIILSLPLVAPMAAMAVGGHWMLPGWIQFALATPVQFWLGARFYRGGWKALRAGIGNMDLLVALGTSAAYALSVTTLLGMHSGHDAHLYFESSAVVIFLVLLGKYLEARTKRKTADAVRALLDLRPETARVRRGSEEIEIPASNIVPGDLLVIRPGERVAVDAILREGSSEFDESMLTGESRPVYRQPGEKIIGGSLNGSGFIAAEASAIGADTTLAKIVKLVESAQSSKAPVQKLVDQIAVVFVPVVVIIAVVAFITWYWFTEDITQALLPAVAVLIIACPCALGLATPIAIIAGTGAAARAGILIKDAKTLERATAVKAVALDKTGTLTLGKPQLVALSVTKGERSNVLATIASLQSGSEHPLARAAVSAAENENLTIAKAENVKAEPGRGVTGFVNGTAFSIGNERLMEELGLSIDSIRTEAKQEAAKGRSVSYLAETGTNAGLLAIMSFADQPRPSARNAIPRLHTMGIAAVMITGDNHDSAATIARELGLDEVEADVLPEDKARIVTELKAKYGLVAMVGDGINDAPALATADLGIAMGSGTDVAIATAGITLIRSDPNGVADAINIASRTRNKIRQNLFWAFIYNIAGIPLAAFGLLNPVFAGAAMALSSVCVVTNALMLRRWKPAKGE